MLTDHLNRPFLALHAAVAIAALFAQSASAAKFRDVTESHLPVPALEGLSMDAKPADVDGDGDLDMIVASEFRPNLLLINDGQGVFSDQSTERLPAAEHDSEDIGVGDFDGDGDVDIVIVSEDDQVNELHLNDGSGHFTDATDGLPVTGTSNAVQVADLSGDGHPDILIGNNGQNRFLLNDGKGGFTDATAKRLPERDDVTQDLELGDVDGDGDADLLVGNEDDNQLLINDGKGHFSAQPDRLPLRDTPEETREADFGDIDGDGDLDILFANIRGFVADADPQNRLLLNDGQGQFEDVTAARLPADSDRCFDGDFIDVDADGDLDIVTSNANRGDGPRRIAVTPWRVYLNDGSGQFTEGTDSVLPDSAAGRGFDVEAGDFDGDGRLDLYLASRRGTDRLLLGIP